MQENTSPLPSSWADSRGVQLDESSYDYYEPQQTTNVGYMDMNGEQQMVPAPPGWRRFGWMFCTCCMDPCSTGRRQEYLKSLKSFCMIALFIQVIYFFICLAVGGFAPYKQNPLLGPPIATLLKMGAMYPPYLKQGQVFRFVTPIVMHAGIIHLLSNMFCQWRFGLFVERRWGTWRFAVVYMVAGIVGCVGSSLRGGRSVGTGASGALMGIMGGMLMDILLNWRNLQPQQRLPLLVQILAWLSIGILLGLAPGIDFLAHLVGAVAGFLASLAVNAHLLENVRLQMLARIVSSAVIGLFLVVSVICFYTIVTVPSV